MIRTPRRLTPEQQQLAAENTGLVLFVAKRWHGRGLDRDEMLSLGNEILCECAHRWDPSRGIKFNTYVCRSLAFEFGQMLTAKNNSPLKSNREFMDGDEFQSTKQPASDESFIIEEQVRVAMRSLDSREKTVIKMRFFEDKTLKEVGDSMGITRERIRQIQDKCLSKMLRSLTKKQPSGRPEKVK